MAGDAGLPELVGRRVRLRAFEDRDVDVVRAAAHDPAITRITSVPDADDEAEALAHLGRQRGRLAEGWSFVVAALVDDRAVGQLGVRLRDADAGRLQIGCWIGPGDRLRGYGSDALVTAAGWALALPGVHRVDLVVDPVDEASWRTAEQAGFRREGVLRAWEVIEGEPRDMAMYALVRTRPGRR